MSTIFCKFSFKFIFGESNTLLFVEAIVFVTQGKVRENMKRWIIPNLVMVIINIVFLHRLYNNLAVYYMALVSFWNTALKNMEQKLWLVLTILKEKERKSMAVTKLLLGLGPSLQLGIYCPYIILKFLVNWKICRWSETNTPLYISYTPLN